MVEKLLVMKREGNGMVSGIAFVQALAPIRMASS
jgi:hypothetical protein